MIRSRSLLAATLAVATTACTIQNRQSAGDEHLAHMSPADTKAPGTVGSGAQQSASLPPSNASAPARLAATPRHGEWVKVAWEPGSADSLMAWIVYPVTSNAKTPVVIVVHEIFGLSSWIRGVADQVAADGFIAVAPDLISRVRGGPSTVELSGDSARKLIAGVNIAERNKGIQAVANYAMSQPSAAPKYAVIGYCWGGSTTFASAINNGRGFSGGVAFYGGFPYMNNGVPVADSVAKIMKPVMLLNGSKDARIGAAMPAIDSTMKALGKSYMGINYEGAIHGFLRAQDDAKAPTAQCDEACVAAERAANLAATKDGWPKTVAFLRSITK